MASRPKKQKATGNLLGDSPQSAGRKRRQPATTRAKKSQAVPNMRLKGRITEVIEDVRQGKESEIDELYEFSLTCLRDFVPRLVSRRGRAVSSASDVLSITLAGLLDAVRKPTKDPVQNSSQLRHLGVAIARNTEIDRQRKLGAIKRLDSLMDPKPVGEVIDSDQARPDDIVDSREKEAIVTGEVQRMLEARPDTMSRAMLFKSLLEGKSTKQIVEELSDQYPELATRNLKTVQRQILRAREVIFLAVRVKYAHLFTAEAE